MRPKVLIPELLQSIRNEPNLPPNTWYFITAVVLSVLNLPHEVPTVLDYALANDIPISNGHPTHDAQLSIARRIREALIKSSAVSGLPVVINALTSLKDRTSPSLLDLPTGTTTSPSTRSADLLEPTSSILSRGTALFTTLYGKVATRVQSTLDTSGCDRDLGITAQLFYGYLLSPTAILSPVETSWVCIAGLLPQDVNPQLKGHLRGAVNHGASVEQVRAVRAVVIRICERAGMRMLGQDEVGGYGWREEVVDI